MLSDGEATPAEIEKHLERLHRLLLRAQYAEDPSTERWVLAAIVRCEDLLREMRQSGLDDTSPNELTDRPAVRDLPT